MKLVIIGGVAGGASAAARAARLDAMAQIKIFERGNFISFANCGLPYHIGKVIPERQSLLVMTPKSFNDRTGAEVFVRHEVIAIHPERRTVEVKDLERNIVFEESYDRLVIATGSSPVRPPTPGIDDPDIMQLWNIPDMDMIIQRINAGARQAVVIGGGFIGLEAAENLRALGLEVTIVQRRDQVLAAIDREMSTPIQAELRRLGINVKLGHAVKAFNRNNPDRLTVELDNDETLTADFAVLSVGVRPNSELAVQAGLQVNAHGGIVVDEHMRTSQPDIYAVGDVVEVKDPIFGGATMIPLAGPANRQGRIAADNICGHEHSYRGTIGTIIVKVGKLSVAGTGWTERKLLAENKEFLKTYLHPASNASYYPGFAPLNIKLLFAPDGQILGAQIVGEKGVDKRIDVIATAIQGRQKVADLAEMELAYAPPYGSARDPINYAGMIADNIQQGLSNPVYSDAIPPHAFLLDVREPAEAEIDRIPESHLIPLGELRKRLNELPRDRQIVTICKVGLRGYVAERILKNNGFNAATLSGGMSTWRLFNPPATGTVIPAVSCACSIPAHAPAATEKEQTVDVRAMQCPGPVVTLKRMIDIMAVGERLHVLATSGFRPDLEAWISATGNTLEDVKDTPEGIEAHIRKSSGPAAKNDDGKKNDSAAIVVFSNDLDKAMAAFIIANGMAAAGTKVTMFFTFWGLSVLRMSDPPPVKKDLLSRMFGMMLPKGAEKLALSKMHMGGMGTMMMKYVMAKKNVSTLPQLIAGARSLGVKFIACEMAMDVMGLQREELLESVDEIAGVASFANLTRESGTTLFI